MTIFLGFGAAAFVGNEAIIKANPAGNMAKTFISQSVRWRLLICFRISNCFCNNFGCSGRSRINGGSAFAHDFYNEIIRKGKSTEKRASIYGSLCIYWGSDIIYHTCIICPNIKRSIFSIISICSCASANLPVILFTIYWKRFNTTGAISGMIVGLVSAIVLVALSPNVWNPVAGKAIFVGEAIFPYTTPGIISIPLGFLAAYLGTVLSSKRRRDEI